MKPRQITILGCGPAALMAAYAVEQAGHMPRIVGLKVPSQMNGAMYLHQPLPGLNSGRPEGEIVIHKYGTAEGYAAKVYGDPGHPVSWDKFEEGVHPMWFLRETYAKLWEMYEPLIIHHHLEPRDIPVLMHNNPLVISTVPARALCHQPHEFKQAYIAVLTIDSRDVKPGGTHRMIYNGDAAKPWYRMSMINGVLSYEYAPPEAVRLDVDLPSMFRCEIRTGTKPISTDCNCHEHPRYFRVGRFGKWEKGVLTHHAYNDVVKIMQDFNNGRIPDEM